MFGPRQLPPFDEVAAHRRLLAAFDTDDWRAAADALCSLRRYGRELEVDPHAVAATAELATRALSELVAVLDELDPASVPLNRKALDQLDLALEFAARFEGVTYMDHPPEVDAMLGPVPRLAAYLAAAELGRAAALAEEAFGRQLEWDLVKKDEKPGTLTHLRSPQDPASGQRTDCGHQVTENWSSEPIHELALVTCGACKRNHFRAAFRVLPGERALEPHHEAAWFAADRELEELTRDGRPLSARELIAASADALWAEHARTVASNLKLANGMRTKLVEFARRHVGFDEIIPRGFYDCGEAWMAVARSGEREALIEAMRTDIERLGEERAEEERQAKLQVRAEAGRIVDELLESESP